MNAVTRYFGEDETETEFSGPHNGNGHHNGNGNGHHKNGNGNGNGESLFERQLKLKRLVMTMNLPPGARLLFCFLLDMSWLRKFGGLAPGIVGISIRKLCQYLHVQHGTVTGWKRILGPSPGANLIWWRLQQLPNAQPMHVYFISAFHPPEPSALEPGFSLCWGRAEGEEVPLLAIPGGGAGVECGKSALPSAGKSRFQCVKPALPVLENQHGECGKTGTSSAGKSAQGVRENQHRSVLENQHALCGKTYTPCAEKQALEVPEISTIRSTPLGVSGGTGGIGVGKPAPKGKKGGKTIKPKFEPIRPDAFPSRLKEMLAACEEEIFRFKNPAALPTDLRCREFLQEKNAAWLENEAEEKPAAAEKLLKKAAALRQDSENYKWALSDDGREHLTLWKNRAAEIKARLSGKIP